MKDTTNTKKIFLHFMAVLLLTVVVLLGSVSQVSAQEEPKVIIYMFWGDGCPHCAEAEPFLIELAERYPNVELRFYEVWYNDNNLDMLMNMGARYGFEPGAVPTIFLGDKNWTGFGDTIAAEIESAVQGCLTTDCGDAGAGLDFSRAEITVLTEPAGESTAAPATPMPTVTPVPTATTAPTSGEQSTPQSNTIKVPLLGTVDLSSISLFLSTLLIAFVDGFNPCSLWVLSLLLAITIPSGSRKKVVLIGLIFLTVTALIYALFIAGLFSMLSFARYMIWVQSVVALISLVFAAINIKDYFWYKNCVSLTISDKQKPGIMQKMRRVMDAQNSFWGLAGATVVLAAGVSIVEFSCTAGFPVLWSNLLSSQNVAILTFVLLLLVYMLIYQLDELVIFFSAVYTLKASRLEEKQGRILMLIGGMLMLALALVMLIKPALMNDIGSSLIIFAAAFAAAGLVLLVHRWLLPRLGIIQPEKSAVRHKTSHKSRNGKAKSHH